MKKLVMALCLVALTMATFAESKEAKTETATTAVAQVATELSGVITDKNSNEILTGVEVRIEGTNLKAYTDLDGMFSFRNLTPGEYKLVANYISYKKVVIEKVKVNSKYSNVDIQLEASK
jgi:hypothetical protein